MKNTNANTTEQEASRSDASPQQQAPSPRASLRDACSLPRHLPSSSTIISFVVITMFAMLTFLDISSYFFVAADDFSHFTRCLVPLPPLDNNILSSHCITSSFYNKFFNVSAHERVVNKEEATFNQNTNQKQNQNKQLPINEDPLSHRMLAPFLSFFFTFRRQFSSNRRRHSSYRRHLNHVLRRLTKTSAATTYALRQSTLANIRIQQLRAPANDADPENAKAEPPERFFMSRSTGQIVGSSSAMPARHIVQQSILLSEAKMFVRPSVHYFITTHDFDVGLLEGNIVRREMKVALSRALSVTTTVNSSCRRTKRSEAQLPFGMIPGGNRLLRRRVSRLVRPRYAARRNKEKARLASLPPPPAYQEYAQAPELTDTDSIRFVNYSLDDCENFSNRCFSKQELRVAPANHTAAHSDSAAAAKKLSSPAAFILSRAVINMLLLMAGIEPNPGHKPKTALTAAAEQALAHRQNIEETSLISAAERTAHIKCLDFIANEGRKTKAGDIFYAKLQDNHSSPPTAHEVSVRIKDKNTDLVFSYRSESIDARGNTKMKKTLCPYYSGCEVIQLNNARQTWSDTFPNFPPLPQENDADNRFSLIEIKRSQFSSDDTHTIWKDVTDEYAARSVKEITARLVEDTSIMTYRTLDTDLKKQQFAHLVRPIVQGYADIKFDNSLTLQQQIDRKSSILFAFLNIPRKHLRTLKGAARQRLRNQHLAAQLSGRVIEQVTVVSPLPRDNNCSAEEVQDSRQIKVAKRQAQDGNIGRAANALMSTAPRTVSKLDEIRDSQTMNPDEKTAALIAEKHALANKINALHPKQANPDLRLANGGHFDPHRNPDNLSHNISPAQLVKTLRDAASGAAPGQSGWTEELLLDVCSRDEVCALNIAAIIEDIALAHVDRSFLDVLNDCTLITLDKAGGGIRPIALCETFSKIASRFALAADAKLLRDTLPFQYGVSYSNGTDKILHETRAFVRNIVAHGKGGVLTIDFSNAFNAPNRQTMWEKVRDFPNLRRIFAAEYSVESRLRSKTLQQVFFSCSGCRQGTTAGPALFCLTIQDMINELNAINGVRALAYMDDITILAQTGKAAGLAMDVVQRQGRKLSLAVNMKKCEFLSLIKQSDLPESLKDLTPVTCLKRLLGATVGIDDEIEKEVLNNRLADSHEVFLRRLQRCYGPWASAILASCGVPKINHVLRTHAPAVTAELAQKFDEDVEAVCLSWMNADTAKMTTEEMNIMRAFLHLPTTMGGMGFSRAAHLAGPAYEASSVLTTNDKLRSKLQKARSEPVHNRVAAFIDNASSLHKRHRLFNSEKGTASIFRDPKFKADPAAWRMQMLWRVCGRLKGIDDFGLDCPGCKKTHENYLNFMFHVGTCPLISGRNATSGHYKVTKSLLQWCHQAGLVVDSSEPRDVSHVVCPGCSLKMNPDLWNDHKRACDKCHSAVPDPRITGPDGRIWNIGSALGCDPDSAPVAVVFDYTQVGARQQSHLSKSKATLFTERENHKQKLYSEQIGKISQELVILGSTEDGVFNRQGNRLLETLAVRGLADTHEVRHFVQQRQQEAHGSSLANALSRGKFNKHVYEFARSTVHNRNDRLTDVRQASSSALSLVSTDADGARSSAPPAATAPFAPTIIAIRQRVQDNTDDVGSPAAKQFKPLLPDAHSPIVASSRRIYTGNMHVSTARYAELLTAYDVNNPDPSPRMFALHTAMRMKHRIAAEPTVVQCTNDNGKPDTLEIPRRIITSAAAEVQVPTDISRNDDFFHNVRACLYYLQMLNSSNGKVTYLQPATHSTLSSCFSASFRKQNNNKSEESTVSNLLASEDSANMVVNL